MVPKKEMSVVARTGRNRDAFIKDQQYRSGHEVAASRT